jgi:hypothetical protein
MTPTGRAHPHPHPHPQPSTPFPRSSSSAAYPNPIMNLICPALLCEICTTPNLPLYPRKPTPKRRMEHFHVRLPLAKGSTASAMLLAPRLNLFPLPSDSRRCSVGIMSARSTLSVSSCVPKTRILLLHVFSLRWKWGVTQPFASQTSGEVGEMRVILYCSSLPTSWFKSRETTAMRCPQRKHD